MRLAALEPDTPHNLGALIRLAACFGAPLDVIEPCGFPFSEKSVRVRSLDYAALAEIRRWPSWAAFQADRPPGRLALLTTEGATALWSVAFQPTDVLLVGRERTGAPPEVHAAADLRIRVPMRSGARSLNVSHCAAVALGEAIRQTGGDGLA